MHQGLVRLILKVFFFVLPIDKFFNFLKFFNVRCHGYWHQIIFNKFWNALLVYKIVTSSKVKNNLVFIFIFQFFYSDQISHHRVRSRNLLINLFQEMSIPWCQEDQFLPCFCYRSKQLVKFHGAFVWMVCHFDRHILPFISPLQNPSCGTQLSHISQFLLIRLILLCFFETICFTKIH
jgi:hypothetical protein